MEASHSHPDEPLKDRHGRRRSPVTLPGHNKNRRPRNKGRRTAGEVLPRRDVEALLEAAHSHHGQEPRDRAMVCLMYRAGVKVGQLVALERRHYDPESGVLTVPGTQGGPDREVRLDSVSRQILGEWVAARKELPGGPLAPLFCTVLRPHAGNELRTAGIRQMLRSRVERAGVERRVTTEGLRKSGQEHFERRATGVEGELEAYVDERAFQERYREAYDKWRDAQDLYLRNPQRHATRIGHDCREALMLFAGELAAREGVEVYVPPSHTVERLRAILAAHRERLGARTTQLLADGLIPYWGTVSDLAQRQEHGASREGEPLGAEDARRVVFQTMLVMYEVDRAVSSF